MTWPGKAGPPANRMTSPPMPPIITGRELEWDRRHDESRIAHHAFMHYRDLLQGQRQVRAALVEHMEKCRGVSIAKGKLPGSYARWRIWRTAYEWDNRVASWDRSLDLSQRAAIESAQRDHAEEWVKRRSDFRESAYQDSRLIADAVRKMLAHPLTEESTSTHEEVTDDGKVLIVRQTIIKPARWTMADVGKLALAAHKMAEMATQLSDDERPLTIQGLHALMEEVGKEDGIDPVELLREIDQMDREDAGVAE